MLSEISQTKTNTVWSLLHVELNTTTTTTTKTLTETEFGLGVTGSIGWGKGELEKGGQKAQTPRYKIKKS